MRSTRLRAALDRLVVRAQEEGTIRTDVTGQEVRMLLNGVTQVLADADEHDPQVWRRYMSLTADGLRAGARGVATRRGIGSAA